MTRREGGKALAAAEAIGRENLGTLDELIREVAKRVGPRVLEWRVVWGIEPLIGLIVMHTAIVTAREMRLGELAEQLKADKTERDQLRAELDQARALRIMPRSVEPLIDPHVHTPARIRRYLKAHGWTLHAQYLEATQWRTEDKTRPGWEHQGSIVAVYDEARWSDYALQVAGLVVDLAGLHGTGELQVLADIEAAGDA